MNHAEVPLRRARIRPVVLLTLIFCAAWIAIIAPRALGDRGKWVSVQSPMTRMTEMASLLSYSDIVDGYAIHRENVPTMRGVAMLEGASVAAEFYHLRVVYNYLTALIAPFIGLFTSFVLLNLAAWLAMTYLSWRFARSLTDDPAAGAISAALTVGALGFVIHVSDYSAHLLAATTYFGGIVALHETEVWKRRRRLTIHLALGTYMAIAALTYHTGTVLAIVYALLAWRRNRIRDVAVALAIGLTALPIWNVILRWIAAAPVSEVEAGYLKISVSRWVDMLSASPVDFLVHAVKVLTEVTTVDAPWILPLGLLGCLLASGLAGRRVLLLIASLLPIVSLVPWRNITVGDIAYSIFGVVPILHASIATWIAPLTRGRYRIAGIAAVAVLLALQFGWSTGPLRGWQLPVLAYFYGPFDIAGLWTIVPRIESLTGAEPTPHLFGGTATLLQAGLASRPSEILEVAFNPFASLIAKALPTIYLGALILLLIPPGRRRGWWLGGLGVLVVGSSIAAPIADPRPPPYTLNAWTAIKLDAGQSLVYRVGVAPEFVKRLSELPADAVTEFYLGMADGRYEVTLSAGGQSLMVVDRQDYPEKGVLFRVDRAQLVKDLSQSGNLEIDLVASSAVIMRGWQRSDLLGRALTPAGPVLPTLELRAVAPDGTLLLAGF